MLFNSFEFLIFFIVVTGLYFTLPHKLRWLLLLVSSCYFYMAFLPVYILILGFTIVVDYFVGISLENTQSKRKKLYLIFSLIANIGVLAVFKYYNFININLSYLLNNFAIQNPVPYLSILLPIGLSFHTFQAMSYTIEVYKGKQKAEKNFGIFALYVMFYPQLVAGPIERPQNLLHQFYEKHSFEFDRFAEGMKLILWGLFKKIVIADRLSIYVNAVYNNVPQHNGITLILATILFAFQIYCDFSGYSDIAIGTAKVMGFKLMDNFKRPYFSKSISEFWSRWHISLSTWFKDYLYIPLGGNRVSTTQLYTNLFIVFIISGLWHGANWTYIIWGGLNGFYLVTALITKDYRAKFSSYVGLDNFPGLHKFIQIVITFILACFSWIFFRANSVEDAFSIIKKCTSLDGKIFSPDPATMVYIFLGIIFLLLTELKMEFYKGQFTLRNNKVWLVRNLYYAILIIIMLTAGVFDGGQFIYFQF